MKRLGRTEEALTSADRAITADANAGLAYAARGSVYQERGRTAEARADFERALSLSPEEALVHFNAACFWTVEGDVEQARSRLARALELDPHLVNFATSDRDLQRYADEPWFRELVTFKR